MGRRRDSVEVGIAVAMLAMVGFVSYAFKATGRVVADAEAVARDDVPLFGDAWEVRYLDEVLTHSASRYVDTSTAERVAWADRYDRAALRLEEIFEIARARANPRDIAHIERVSEANDTLVALETRILELADAGRTAEARAILGGEYVTHKATYRDGIDAYFAARKKHLDERGKKVAANARSTKIAVLVILGVIGGILGFLGRVNQLQRSRNAARVAERNAFAATQLRHARVHQGLEMSLTEEQALRTLGDALAEELPEWSTELLLADSSHAHLRQARTSAEDRCGPCCDVLTPDRCPAIRRGTSLVFSNTGSYDACPYLRERALSGGTAICLPLNVMGQSIGVSHSVSPSELGDGDFETIHEVVQVGVDRIGVLRAFATTETQASRDPLTGLLNRRSLEDRVQGLEARGLPYVVAFCDLDHFKALNDTYGHSAGDRGLRLFSRAIRSALRPTDLVARWGGEEFVIVFSEMNPAYAERTLHRIRESLATTLETADQPPFTFSAGVGDPRSESLHDAIQSADAALLEAKQAGRDQIVVSARELTAGLA